ncbi:MAG: phosphatase PAP2 family protein [bacterium]|nr:phosphatase PAP2 family protein [bacterium]
MNESLFRLINAGWKNPFFDWLMPVLSDKDLVVLPGLVVVGLVLHFGKRHARTCVLALALALGMSDLTTEKVLKPAFGADRPYVQLADVNLHQGGRWMVSQPEWHSVIGRKSHSFPSSHAANIAVVAVVLAFAGRRSLWVMLPLALGVGYSRIYTGNHFPGDVLVGWAWGGLCGAGLAAACPRLVRRVFGPELERVALPTPPARMAFYWLLSAWTLMNLAFIWLNWFELAGDEAQYWDWSRQLALGYYSKPPMVAYLMRMLVGAGGNKEYVIRFGAVMLTSGTLALIYALALRITRREPAALLAAGLAMAMPATWVGSVLLTIDPILIFFWALAMYAFHRAVNGHAGMWWWTGFALGLAMLSKYTVVFLLIAFVAYLVLVDRSHLRRPGPYIALAVAAICMSGVVYWNATNDWISIRHTASIGAQEANSVGRAVGRVGEFFLGQAGVVSPILFGCFLWAMGACANRVRVRRFRANRDAAFLVLCFGVLFGGYALISLTHTPNANWPVCSYVAGACALAWVWTQKERSPAARRLLIAAVALGCVFGAIPRGTGALYAASDWFAGDDARPDRIHLGGLELDPDSDPTNRLRGARELGQALERHTGAHPKTGPFPFSDRYQVTALMAFYTKGRPDAYCMNVGDRRYNQYDLWDGWSELKGRDGLFVTGGGQLKAVLFIDEMVNRGFFERGEFRETVEVWRGSVLIRTYTISKMFRYTGKPWTPEVEKF